MLANWPSLSQTHTLTPSPPLPPLRVNEAGEPPSTESATSSPVEMAVGEEDPTAPSSSSSSSSAAGHKLPVNSDTPTPTSADPYPALENTSGLVTMETVMPGGEGGEVVGGMSQHNGLPGYSPPRERQDSEATLDLREGVEPPGGEEEEEDDDET